MTETKMDNKLAITLKIAGGVYKFTIDREKEEAYRLAEREVNSYLAQSKQKRIKGWGDMDYLAIAALNFAITNINMRQSREVSSDEVGQLEALDSEVRQYLEKQIK